MPVVVDVEGIDDVESPEPFGGRPPPSWRRFLGIAVGIVLVAGTAYSEFHSAGSASQPARAGSVEEDVLASARTALGDWGRFGVSGDLALVTGSFDESGPQFRELQREAAAISAGPPGPPAYTFTIASPTVVTGAGANERIVRSDVVVSRANESDQQFQWDLVLRHGSENRWLLWTVRDRRNQTNASLPVPVSAPPR